MCKKLISKTLSRTARLEGVLMPCDNSRAQKEEECILFFPGKDSIRVSLFSLAPQLPFPIYKSVFLPLPHGDLHVAHHSCRPQTAFLSVLNEHFFAGAIFGSFI